MLEASVVVIGDEILGGYVAERNAGWLAGRLTAHGIPLTRLHVVPDDASAIDEALQLELARSRPRLVVTSGGIGSTPDDLTYEAVARSLGRSLVEEPTIAERIAGAIAWTRDQGVEVSEAFSWHLHRMARIPAGSRLLHRDAGWAPGVAVDVDGGIEADGATIAVLPGVPTEFQAIVEEVVEPQLLVGRNPPPRVVEIEHPFPESALNLTFAEVLERFPQVKLGSYPGRRMVVRLTGPDATVEQAAATVRSAVQDLAASDGGRNLAAAWARRRGIEPEEDDA